MDHPAKRSDKIMARDRHHHRHHYDYHHHPSPAAWWEIILRLYWAKGFAEGLHESVENAEVQKMDEATERYDDADEEHDDCCC